MKWFSKIKSLKNNETIVNGSLFSLFSFINRGFSFLLLLILANYIVPSEYGYLSLFGTVVMVIGYFIALSTEGFLSVSFFRDGTDGLKQTFSCILFTSLIVAFLGGAVLFCYGKFFSTKLDLPLHCLYSAFGINFFMLYSNLFLDYYRLQKKVQIYGFFTCGNAFCNFILSIFLVKVFLLGWEGRVYAQLSCSVLFGLIGLFFFLNKKFIVFPNLNHWKMMITWGLPLIPHLATNFIRQGCDRYVINYFHSIEDVGLFSFALTLTNIVTMIGVGFNQSNSVDIYSILGNTELKAHEKLVMLNHQKKNIFLIYLLCSVAVVFVGYITIPYILPKYSSAMKYFPLLTLYAFFHCLYFLYTNFLFFYKKTKNLMMITFLASTIHLCFSFLLTRYSLYLTCVIYIVSQMLIFVMVRSKANSVLLENCK